jgi:hypothetical protein
MMMSNITASAHHKTVTIGDRKRRHQPGFAIDQLVTEGFYSNRTDFIRTRYLHQLSPITQQEVHEKRTKNTDNFLCHCINTQIESA